MINRQIQDIETFYQNVFSDHLNKITYLQIKKKYIIC